MIKRIIISLPLTKQIYYHYVKTRHHRRFAGDCFGCYIGIFTTFEEAISAAPNTKPIGYNHPDLAQSYLQAIETNQGYEHVPVDSLSARPHDYPVLFWLKTLFETFHEGCQLFDFGGNVGKHYFTYENYLKYPKNLRWTICEVPEMVRVGRTLAEKRKRNNLKFTTSFAGAGGSDIFLASGSLQYIDNLKYLLQELAQKPQHIIINRIPFSDHPRFVLLQNGGEVFYPQYVFHKETYIMALINLGYELVDQWEDHTLTCKTPTHPDFDVNYHHGLYFKYKGEMYPSDN